MLEHSQPRSSRGVSGDDPEGGARRGVPRRRLVTARPGRQGPRPPGTTTWVRGARCTDPSPPKRQRRRVPETEARPREPKTATVERREASVPRHKRVHARLDALRDARRLASAWPAASCAGPTGAAAPERLSALRPPLDSGERSKVAKARAQKTRRGNEKIWAV